MRIKVLNSTCEMSMYRSEREREEYARFKFIRSCLESEGEVISRHPRKEISKLKGTRNINNISSTWSLTVEHCDQVTQRVSEAASAIRLHSFKLTALRACHIEAHRNSRTAIITNSTNITACLPSDDLDTSYYSNYTTSSPWLPSKILKTWSGI